MALLKILLAIVAFLLFTSFLGFYTSVRPPRIVSDITPKDLGLDYEEVSFITSDSIKLIGWWLPSEAYASAGKPAKTIILLHGYPADKGNILPALAFLN